MKCKLNINYKKLLADTVTPVSIYLRLRDKFPNSILLESSDYHGQENSFSFICCEPLAGYKVENEQITISYPDGVKEVKNIVDPFDVVNTLQSFLSSFEPAQTDLKFLSPGLFGYTAYDSIRYFEDIRVSSPAKDGKSVPDMMYSLYRYIIAIDHFKEELYLIENTAAGQAVKGFDYVESLINNKNFASFHFSKEGIEQSNFTNEQYLDIVAKGKQHCHRGDVFQVVLSREFSQQFKGDEFNVYRTLRSVNPSPYLFYFDYGNFKIFGSSPEAQLVVKNNEASIHPIAGTFKRTGNDQADAELAEKLKLDAKENAEHVMLVDLARNDLSRNCHQVVVETFREIQYYSHVIHLVSKVTGQMKKGTSTLNVMADTFPAGTLSGAPKHKAMQIIDKLENNSRGFYGGCIGLLGFNGDFNHAIMIRSFLSKNNHLFYQAGAGVVESSNEQSELNEVNNKLAALKKAIELAESI